MATAPPTAPHDHDRTVTLVLHRAVVAALGAAGGIHLAVAIDHGLRGSHGTFFALSGAAQVVLALLVARCAGQLWLRATALLSAAIAGVWLVSRIPFLGGAADPVGALDLATTALEVLALVGAGALLRRPLFQRQHEPRPAHLVARLSGASLAVGAAFLVATGIPAPGHPGHDHEHGPAHAGDPTPTLPVVADERPSIFGDLFEDHGHHWGPAETSAAAGPPQFQPHDHADGEAPHEH